MSNSKPVVFADSLLIGHLYTIQVNPRHSFLFWIGNPNNPESLRLRLYEDSKMKNILFLGYESLYVDNVEEYCAKFYFGVCDIAIIYISVKILRRCQRIFKLSKDFP